MEGKMKKRQMIKYLKTIILTRVCISTICASGQDTTKTKKIREYYFALAEYSIVNISIKYKRQLKNKTFFKIGLVNLSASGNSYIPNNSLSYRTQDYSVSAGLESGFEFRRTISDKFAFFHGPNASFIYSIRISYVENPTLPQDQRKNTFQSYTGGIPYTVGLLFHLNNHFLFSAEINPGLFFTHQEADSGSYPSQNRTTYSADFRLANKNGLLSVAYRL